MSDTMEKNKRDYTPGPRIGITFSTFDLLHAGHIMMLEEAKRQCDYLICGLQMDPTLDRPEKNQPTQTVVERYIQLRGCEYVDEIVPYSTEQDLEDILMSFKLDVRIVGDEYKDKYFTGRKYCEQKGIELYFNRRDHRFSSSALRRIVATKESENSQTIAWGKDQKIEIVKKIVTGEMLLEEVMKQYGIKNKITIKRWLNLYMSQVDSKDEKKNKSNKE